MKRTFYFTLIFSLTAQLAVSNPPQEASGAEIGAKLIEARETWLQRARDAEGRQDWAEAKHAWERLLGLISCFPDDLELFLQQEAWNGLKRAEEMLSLKKENAMTICPVFCVRVLSSPDRNAADSLKKQLDRAGYSAVEVMPVDEEGKRLYHVFAGEYEKKEDAEKLLRDVRRNGHLEARVWAVSKKIEVQVPNAAARLPQLQELIDIEQKHKQGQQLSDAERDLLRKANMKIEDISQRIKEFRKQQEEEEIKERERERKEKEIEAVAGKVRVPFLDALRQGKDPYDTFVCPPIERLSQEELLKIKEREDARHREEVEILDKIRVPFLDAIHSHTGIRNSYSNLPQTHLAPEKLLAAFEKEARQAVEAEWALSGYTKAQNIATQAYAAENARDWPRACGLWNSITQEEKFYEFPSAFRVASMNGLERSKDKLKYMELQKQAEQIRVRNQLLSFFSVGIGIAVALPVVLIRLRRRKILAMDR
jgi:hypothetical protein